MPAKCSTSRSRRFPRAARSQRSRAKHRLRHPLGEDFEGFPDFVPQEITAAQIADAQRQVTTELLGDGTYAGSVAEIVSQVQALVAAGLRHVVIWNLGVLVSGGSPAELVRLALLIRRLRRLPLPADGARVVR